MTIDPNSDLFKAILSMDSYNRGYNAGIVFGTDPNNSEAVDGQTKVGVVTVYDSAGDEAAKADGFYAIAYQLPDDSVTISYRGTDQVMTDNGIGGDGSAFSIAAGTTDAAQGLDAFQFFNDVAAQLEPADPDPFLADITVTGHSDVIPAKAGIHTPCGLSG